MNNNNNNTNDARSIINNTIVNDPWYKQQAYKIFNSGLNTNKGYLSYEDHFHDTIVIMLEADPTKITDLYNRGLLKYHFIMILINKRKEFNKPRYKRIIYSTELLSIIDDDIKVSYLNLIDDDIKVSYLNLIDAEIDLMPVANDINDWYNRSLFKLWVNCNYNISEVERLTKINRNSINNDVNQYLNNEFKPTIISKSKNI